MLELIVLFIKSESLATPPHAGMKRGSAVIDKASLKPLSELQIIKPSEGLESRGLCREKSGQIYTRIPERWQPRRRRRV